MPYLLLCSLLWASTGLSPKAVRNQIEDILAHPKFADSFWGIVVYAPARNKTLMHRNAGHNFRPASNLKILTTILALEHLGPDFRFDTEIGYRGTLGDGVIQGDLVITASGDPSISGNYGGAWRTQDYLAAIIQELRAHGVQEVTGDLVAVVDALDDRHIQYSWEWDDIGNYYAVPVTPLSLNNGWIQIQLSTDEQGTVTLKARPENTPGLQFNLSVTGNPGEETVEWKRDWGTNHFRIHGNLPPCETLEFNPAAWNTTEQFLGVFHHTLNEAGIHIQGRHRVESGNPVEIKPLLVHQSESLADMAQVLMKVSQNHYADLFLKTTARHVQGEGSFEAGEKLAEIYLKALDGSEGQRLRDGSGLSAQNYIQPQQLASLLKRGLEADWRDHWLRTLPVFGLDGTLAKRGDDETKGFVWAKTGYINRARNLVGYVETHAGEPLIFVALANNYSCRTREVEEAQDQICAVLRKLKPNRRYRKATHRHHLLSRTLR
ncbi:MAG: D-alanyl-D-alanine carboxypeptidase/D-alanyl-D-alanine-endopeptidase [Acidobacteriota bacterium]|nr:D-alanyl-D-alanine carboxypeptidase/D-alanyl-D-alanine-endopeptidase [Acidobacteriota bacterium]